MSIIILKRALIRTKSHEVHKDSYGLSLRDELGEAEVFPMPPKGNNPLKAIPKKDRKKDKAESDKPAAYVPKKDTAPKTEPKKEEPKKEAPKATAPKTEPKKEEPKKK